MTAGMSPVSYCVSPPGREMPATPQVRCLLYSQARLLTCMDAHKFCLSHEGRVDLWAMRSRVEAEPGAVPGPILEEVSGACCSRMDSGTGVHPRGRSGGGHPRAQAKGTGRRGQELFRVKGVWAHIKMHLGHSLGPRVAPHPIHTNILERVDWWGRVGGWLGKRQQGAAQLPEAVDYLFSMDHIAMLRCGQK